MGVIVDGEPEVADLALGLLLGAEVPQAVLVEGSREGLAQVVQQVVVEVINPALAQRLVEHGPSVIGVLGEPRGQLRGDLEGVTGIAFHQRLPQRPFRFPIVVAASGIEVRETGPHEPVHQLAASLDVDGRRIVLIRQRQPHEPKAQRRQLPCVLHGNPLLCAFAQIISGTIISRG